MIRQIRVLLGSQRFLPLFLAQALGAFNYSLIRSAVVAMLILQSDAVSAGLAAALLVVPLFLFSANAGRLADRHPKAKVARIIKVAELGITLFAAVAVFVGVSVPLIITVFLVGVLTTYFRPAMYGLLADLLDEGELAAGNALILASTFLGILLGAASAVLLLAHQDLGGVPFGIIAIVLAVLGWLASKRIPEQPGTVPALAGGFNIWHQSIELIQQATTDRAIFLSLIAIGWFWFVGGLYFGQIPMYGRELYGEDPATENLILGVFAGGIALGALLGAASVGRFISLTPVPFAALGTAAFSIDLSFAVDKFEAPAALTLGIAEFLAVDGSWRVLADIILASACGGIFVVPLYALIQARVEPQRRGRVFAASNLFNATFLVLSALLAAIAVAAEARLFPLFVVTALGSIAMAILFVWVLPGHVLKGLFRAWFSLAYRVEVSGREHIDNAGPRTLVVINHVSYLDGPLMMAFMTELPVFAVFTGTANLWWIKPFWSIASIFPIDPTNPMATKSLVAKVKEGRPCVIFPEGRLSVTGALMKIFPGPAYIADRADADIVAVRLDGAERTYFTRLKSGEVDRKRFPKIRITVLEPTRLQIDEKLRGRVRHAAAGQQLYEIMSNMMFRTTRLGTTLFDALLEARDRHGGHHPVLEDFQGRNLNYNKLIVAAMLLGKRFAAETTLGERVGVLLPNATGTAVTFYALQAFGRVAAMLNYSTGVANMCASVEAAEIRVVIASRQFVEQAKLEPAAEALAERAKFIWLEDIRDEVRFSEKLKAALDARKARRIHRSLGIARDAAAVVLFTSGTEGKPKGVVLSHGNLLSNCAQTAARVDYNQLDKCFCALPLFHSFGLTGAFLLPSLFGIRVFLYPSPLHYQVVPEMVYDSNSTILFGTNSFLKGYANRADPYDFRSVRYVFAGGEALQDETQEMFHNKFGLRILSGYGATETSPVIATNTPMHFRPGMVGRLLPGIESKLETVEGLERGRRLWVKGPNVMLGYLRYEAPGVIDPPEDGWYDTGDIVEIDDDGFVAILGRAKRFAKIGGEMVSLSAVESLAIKARPDHTHVVVNLPDPRKGEKLVLITDDEGLARKDILAAARAQGISELAVPSDILCVDEVPLLGTGKVDYTSARQIAEERAGQ